MATGYDNVGQDEFGAINDETTRSLPGNVISRSKFNPYTHPLAYSMRIGTFTRARSITHAGAGGLFMGKLMRPFAALAVGAATPLGAAGLGMLAAAGTDPDDIGSFGMRSYIFGRMIGVRRPDILTRSAGRLVNTGGGIARGLRIAGLDQRAASLENFAVGGKSVIRGSLFGTLPRYGMHVPTSKALSRLYTGLGPGHTLSGMEGQQATELIKSLGPVKETIGYRTRMGVPVVSTAGMGERGRAIYELSLKRAEAAGAITKRVPITRTVSGLDTLGLLPTYSGYADEIYDLAKKRKFGGMDKLVGKYNASVTKEWGGIMSRFKGGKLNDFTAQHFYENVFRAAGKEYPFVTNLATSYKTRDYFGLATSSSRAVSYTGGTTTFDYSVLRKFATDPKFAAGRIGLFTDTQLGKLYTSQYNRLTNPAFGGAIGAEARLSFKFTRSRLFSKIREQVATLGTELGKGAKVDLVEHLGSTQAADSFVKGLPKASRKLVNKNRILSIGKNNAFKFGASEQLKASVSMQNQLTSGIGNKAFSSFLWLTLGFHYGKKAIGGLLNSAAKGIEAGSRLQMQMSHLEFGTGKSLQTQQASTERTRALQAIQYSGLNARSYLGKESQIYSR